MTNSSKYARMHVRMSDTEKKECVLRAKICHNRGKI